MKQTQIVYVTPAFHILVLIRLSDSESISSSSKPFSSVWELLTINVSEKSRL
ncbi:MAG: hypothetical protein O3C04_04315 [Crenarchaeota archaeon]|nr:hypothetical protein [Thermoproteota archaeon]MDA1124854.1 hypothetical protein [Thermoproteota archaeon]